MVDEFLNSRENHKSTTGNESAKKRHYFVQVRTRT